MNVVENCPANLQGDIESELEYRLKHLAFSKLATIFADESIVIIENFFSPEIIESLRKISHHCINSSGYLRDLTLKTTENTPRVYKSCGYNTVKDKAPIIDYLHTSARFQDIVAKVIRLTPASPAFAAERYIINQQCGLGHTHGWHWDDYSIAMGLCIDDAAEDEGGYLEFVPNTEWDKQNPNIRHIVETHEVQRVKIPKGALYINRADTTLHRVTPLNHPDSVRTMIVFSYQTEADQDKNMAFETMEELYPEDCANA